MKRKAFILTLFAAIVCMPSLASAGVNDFTISSFKADYYLSKTSEGRSRLRTVERIVAEFPSFDQNHGIERAVPHAYDGHTLHLKVESILKADGSAWNYTTYSQGDATVLRVGDADRYVHGSQTYIVTYTQQDVTKYFADTNDDELYWDTNGTGWSQPFSSVQATVHIDASLTNQLDESKNSCYQGVQDSKEPCEITASTESNGSKVFSAKATRVLSPGENVTFVVVFKPHTFAVYKQTAFEKYLALFIMLLTLSFFVMGFVGVALIIWFVVRYYKYKYRKGDMGAIVPEYIPPKDASVLVSAKVFSETKGNPQSALIVDLAVRHYIKIYQTSDKKLFQAAEYELELIKPIDDLKPEERTFVTTLFDGQTRYALKSMKNNTKLHSAFLSNDRSLTKALATPEYGVYEKDIEDSKWFKRAGTVTLVFAIVTLSPACLVAAILAFVFAHTTLQVSEKGLALERYLYGLRDYIKLAETERLRMLQSPEGAQKVGETVDGANTPQLIKLYERVLPYAVLFGEEKQWNKELSKYYETTQTQPVWYSGTAPFTAAAFSSAMSSFSTASSYSSSSGGSSGGGSSGGGGGGGGGGGW